jgi:hypothetical protein
MFRPPRDFPIIRTKYHVNSYLFINYSVLLFLVKIAHQSLRCPSAPFFLATSTCPPRSVSSANLSLLSVSALAFSFPSLNCRL